MRDSGIVGVDESGRGTLVGPVIAAAVLLPARYETPEDEALAERIKDSKKLSAKARRELASFIHRVALGVGVGRSSVEEIDAFNILNATFLAMHRALDELSEVVEFDEIEVDGSIFKPYAGCEATCVPRGDSLLRNIAAASIVAKVERDAFIEDLCAREEEGLSRYDLSKNKGYPSPRHLAALADHGATVHHRSSFRPVHRAANATRRT